MNKIINTTLIATIAIATALRATSELSAMLSKEKLISHTCLSIHLLEYLE